MNAEGRLAGIGNFNLLSESFPNIVDYIYIYLDLNICYQSQERSTYEQPGLVADPLSAVSK